MIEWESQTSTSSVLDDDGNEELTGSQKTAVRSLVRDMMKMIIDKSGQRVYPPEEYKAICDRLLEKLWAETKPRVLNISPDTITCQGKAIFKDLLKECSKPENILLLLQAGTLILERSVLTTMSQNVGSGQHEAK